MSYLGDGMGTYV